MNSQDVKIVVKRPTGFRDATRKYAVILDGETVGRIGRGGTMELATTPGSHTIQAKIDWSGSPEMSFIAGNSSVVNVELKAKSAFNAIVDVFSRTKWIDIEVTVSENPV